MHLTHKIRLYPTSAQITGFRKACGCARVAYNWGLTEWTRQYEAGLKPSALSLKKQFNAVKGGLYPFVYESPKDANQQPFTNLGEAFQKFFNKKAKHPVLKKKGRGDSFYISNDKILLEGNKLRLPLMGDVLMAECLRLKGRVLSVTVSRTAEFWFASIAVEVENFSKPRTSEGIVGVDLGLKTFVTISDGLRVLAPKPLKKNLKKLKRTQRKHSRKVKGSKNREKSRKRLGRLNYKISCVRQDFLHKLTTKLCRENQTVVIEDLNVSGMQKNHKLAMGLSDASFGEFRRQLTYKVLIYGTFLVVADRWFPSSKLCSRCGHKKETLGLSERTYACEACGFVCDRDLNAAINLKNISTPGYGGIYAYGQPVLGLDEVGRINP